MIFKSRRKRDYSLFKLLQYLNQDANWIALEWGLLPLICTSSNLSLQNEYLLLPWKVVVQISTTDIWIILNTKRLESDVQTYPYEYKIWNLIESTGLFCWDSSLMVFHGPWWSSDFSQSLWNWVSSWLTEKNLVTSNFPLTQMRWTDCY